jgi:hypothetical protein
VVLQHPRRTTGALLPIWQPNSNSSGGNCTKRAHRGVGGGQPRRSRRKPRIDKLARNFIPNGLRASFLWLSKKRVLEPLRDYGPIPRGTCT